MFIQTLLAIILGIILGIVTGLIPGVHVNLITVGLVSLSTNLTGLFTPLQITVIILSMAVTHTFLDTIPSTFLGAPEEDTALGVLPGHKLLMEGKGYEAVMLTLFGSYTSLLVSLAAIPLFFLVLEKIYQTIAPYIGYILILASGYLIIKEEKKILAGILFGLSGVLGILVFKTELEQGLFPLFSGLFGISTLFLSLKNKTNIPKQIFEIKDKVKIKKEIGIAVAIGWIASFLPGLGTAQAAAIGSTFSKGENKKFLVLVGGLSTVNMVLSLLTLHLLNKARNGAVVGISNILSITFKEFILFLCIALLVGSVVTFLAIPLIKIFATLITKVKYSSVCVAVIVLLFILVGVLTKGIGLFILLVSTSLGIIPQIQKVSRSQLMGCLLIPTIIFFLS
jgi:putative membrane protein